MLFLNKARKSNSQRLSLNRQKTERKTGLATKWVNRLIILNKKTRLYGYVKVTNIGYFRGCLTLMLRQATLQYTFTLIRYTALIKKAS